MVEESKMSSYRLKKSE